MSSYSTFECEDILFIHPIIPQAFTKTAISARYVTFIEEHRHRQPKPICKAGAAKKAQKDNQRKEEDLYPSKYYVWTNRYISNTTNI